MAAPLPSATTAPEISNPLMVTFAPIAPSVMIALPFGGDTVALITTMPPTACNVMLSLKSRKSLV